MSTPATLGFDNPLDLLMWADPKARPADWQCEELLRLGGYRDGVSERVAYDAAKPYTGCICANNGAGKDSFVIAPLINYGLTCREDWLGVTTSASAQQISTQTEANVRNLALKINKRLGRTFIETRERRQFCGATRSESLMFSTDEPGKAEGYHPKEPGAEMYVILNEIKSIPDAIINAVMRCSGYTHWLEISSPGETPGGHFYNTCMQAAHVYPAPLVPGEWFFRRVTAFDCPWVTPFQIENIKRAGGGENSALYRSSVLALFTVSNENSVIPSDALLGYPPFVPDRLNMPKVAGLDLSLGGDETVLSIWQGNRRLKQLTWRIDNEPRLTAVLVQAFANEGLAAQNIYVDAKGLGQPILHRIWEAGWQVNGTRGDAPAGDRTNFARKNIEMWWLFRRLVVDKLIQLPLEDKEFMLQLEKRRYEIVEAKANYAKKQLESKKRAKVRGEASPDRVDAAVLAFYHLYGRQLPQAQNLPPAPDSAALIQAVREAGAALPAQPNLGVPRFTRAQLVSMCQQLKGTEQNGNRKRFDYRSAALAGGARR